jgi:C1A family cysteine protease
VDYKLGVNQFFDRTEEELAQVTQSFKPSPASSKLKSSKRKVAASKLGSHPESLDWSEQGAVTSVKNQGSCGSCWAFAAAAGAESTLILSGKENATVDLSEQYLVECTYGSDCGGTYYMSYVMEEILEGVPREATYPYIPWQSSPGICSTDQKVEVAEDYFQYDYLDDEEIIELLQKGPLVITISADGWSYYSSGVFSCSYYDRVNHAVLLVGYAPDYWLIKNSWDDDWGENGYIRITRDRNQNCWIGNEVLEFDFDKCTIPGCL